MKSLFKKFVTISIASLALVLSTYASSIDVSGSLTQFGRPIKFQKVFFRGSGVDTNVTSDNNGRFFIQLNPSDQDGIFAAFTKNCIGDTLTLFKQYEPNTITAVLNFKLCESIQSTSAKGVVNYQGNPLPNAVVVFCLNASYNVIDSVVTDSNGFFLKTFAASGQSTGLLYASIRNCDGQEIKKSSIYSVNDTCLFDFNYCAGGNFKLLTGRVINPNLPMMGNDFTLELYKYNEQTLQLEFDQEQESKMEGTFQFLLNREKKYLIKAVPNAAVPAVPNYYGNSIYWNEATVINVLPSDSIKIINIPVDLLPPYSQGNSDISCNISNEKVNAANMFTVYLLDENQKLVDFSSCQKNDRFRFTNISSGKYSLYVDVVGIPTNAPLISLEENMVFSSLKITVTNKEVSFEDVVLSNPMNHTSSPGFSVFPKPFGNQLELKSNHSKKTALVINDMMGKTVYEATLTPFSSSIVNTTLWERGIYVVYSADENQIIGVTKTVKQ